MTKNTARAASIAPWVLVAMAVVAGAWGQVEGYANHAAEHATLATCLKTHGEMLAKLNDKVDKLLLRE